MERRDILVIIGALVVVLILAVVVKPMLTGKDVDLGIPQTPPAVCQTEIIQPSPVETEPAEIIITPEPTPVLPSEPEKPLGTGADQNGRPTPPLPIPTLVTWQADPDNPMPAIQMVEYADIVGRYTGSTAPVRIPTPYWELLYNVTPSEESPVFMLDVIEKGDKPSEDKTIRSMVYRPGKPMDPKEGRFFEGGRDYILNITAERVEKYRIIISIPLKYIPDA